MAQPHNRFLVRRAALVGGVAAVSIAAAVLGACQARRTGEAGADNSLCYHCHGGYRREPLSQRHARAGVGCADCHGKSVRHLSDPNGVAPPDRMYPKEAVNLSCMECHPQRELAAMKAHRSLFSAATEEQKLCTDCHGKHRLQNPRRRWDKVTGDLVWPERSEIKNLAEERPR